MELPMEQRAPQPAKRPVSDGRPKKRPRRTVKRTPKVQQPCSSPQSSASTGCQAEWLEALDCDGSVREYDDAEFIRIVELQNEERRARDEHTRSELFKLATHVTQLEEEKGLLIGYVRRLEDELGKLKRAAPKPSFDQEMSELELLVGDDAVPPTPTSYTSLSRRRRRSYTNDGSTRIIGLFGMRQELVTIG